MGNGYLLSVRIAQLIAAEAARPLQSRTHRCSRDCGGVAGTSTAVGQ
jgi:hypothetical protein